MIFLLIFLNSDMVTGIDIKVEGSKIKLIYLILKI